MPTGTHVSLARSSEPCGSCSACSPAELPAALAGSLPRERVVPHYSTVAIVIALPGNGLRRKTEAVKDISLMGFVV